MVSTLPRSAHTKMPRRLALKLFFFLCCTTVSSTIRLEKRIYRPRSPVALFSSTAVFKNGRVQVELGLHNRADCSCSRHETAFENFSRMPEFTRPHAALRVNEIIDRETVSIVQKLG